MCLTEICISSVILIYIKAIHLQDGSCLQTGLTFMQHFPVIHCHFDVAEVVIDEDLCRDYGTTSGYCQAHVKKYDMHTLLQLLLASTCKCANAGWVSVFHADACY